MWIAVVAVPLWLSLTWA